MKHPLQIGSIIPSSRFLERRIVEAVATLLPPSGRFVAYQVNNYLATLCRPSLALEKTSMELFNIPPMRIFQWTKSG